jgi:glucosamine kinase
MHSVLLLGVDGGGTSCRARLARMDGTVLGAATGGPANIRFGLERSLATVLQVAMQCLAQAGLPLGASARVTGCLALAGASEPAHRAAAQRHPLPFAKVVITSDAQAACIGAHAGADGGVIIAGTGSIGWAELNGRHHRIGGWGLPVSDEGSAAWLGGEALRRVLWAHDGRIAWSALLKTLSAKFRSDPHAIVRFVAEASPRDLGALAPMVVEHAVHDPIARELLQLAATHIDAIAERLIALGAERLALVGGLAPYLQPYLTTTVRRHLVPPKGDALDGALALARAAAAPCELTSAGQRR